MSCVIVPNILRDEIYLKMAQAFSRGPEPFWPSSETWQAIYYELLVHFDRTGKIPIFDLVRKQEGI